MTAKPEHTPVDEAAKTHLRLWLRLLKITRAIEADLRENLRTQFGSTLPRFDVMAALYRYPKGLRMSELSGVLKVSNGNVTGIVDRLVNDGLIIRCPVPGDRRALVVRLTQKGRDEFQRQAEAHEGWIDEMLSGIAPEDAERIIDYFQAVTPAAREEEPAA